ncbi:hypothetical protein JI435_020600 [Parastagonospora nodorum SN15]|uniref:Uncharacterized protein n=1 Tax=Phaeosphaeria nodorum (strain SN15 / ATCC MYA-4574 / FGSC 10173) TaxID=321614 RepID=A0A7U2HU22_PHANO|nr:hypothetical protein JI435_020600 [Parastagonospora nodorum SN15]
MADKECVVCTKPAYIWCQRCAETEVGGRPLNTTCFSKDDKKDLLDRAYRAGELVQVIFYSFIEHTWTYDMSNIKIIPDRDREIRALEVTRGPGNDNGPGGESTCEQYAGGWLYKIPPELFRSAAEQKAKHMLLADQRSVWMFMNMHFVVRALFKDLINDPKQDIKELVHRLPNGTRRFVRHIDSSGKKTKRDDLKNPDEDALSDLKGVYRITLKDGTKLALDLAGAQYDLHHSTVEPWIPYLNRSASEMKYRVPFRSHYDKHMAFMSNFHHITHMTIELEQLKSLDSMLTSCRSTPGFELGNMFVGDNDHLLLCRNKLEMAVVSCLQERPNQIDADKLTYIVAPFDLRHPTVIEKMDKAAAGESALFDVGDMRKFDWSKLSDMIKMPGDVIKYAEKKKAKNLLQFRCVYKMPGDWRLVFLENDLPSEKVPPKCISENPYWKGKGKGQ